MKEVQSFFSTSIEIGICRQQFRCLDISKSIAKKVCNVLINQHCAEERKGKKYKNRIVVIKMGLCSNHGEHILNRSRKGYIDQVSNDLP